MRYFSLYEKYPFFSLVIIEISFAQNIYGN